MDIIKQAVILVGGRGTRLGSLTERVPKPMLPIGGVPFLEYQLEFLRKWNVTHIVFCAGYMGESIRSHFANGAEFGFDISYHIEAAPAGTGGAIWEARSLLDPVFYVLNGDTLFDINLFDLARTFSSNKDLLAALV